MNRMVGHEEGKRSAMRADEKGSPPNKNAWQSRHAFNFQRNFNTTLRKFIERCFEVDRAARSYRDRSLPLFEPRLVNGDCVFAGC